MNSTMNEAQSISAYGPARSIVEGNPIEPDELKRMQAYWNATLFLSAGMIYLRDNLLLREPLKAEILQNIFPRQDAIPDPPNMLRHACGFKLANDGHDTRALQHYLGHKNIQHTVRYTEMAPDRFKDFWKD